VDVPWAKVLYSTFVPAFSLNKDYVVTVVAVLGTTITPYCFFWQASQEAEDQRIDPSTHPAISSNVVSRESRTRLWHPQSCLSSLGSVNCVA
jgi:Mn2+/Fe2+ NRAMP family transporter